MPTSSRPAILRSCVVLCGLVRAVSSALIARNKIDAATPSDDTFDSDGHERNPDRTVIITDYVQIGNPHASVELRTQHPVESVELHASVKILAVLLEYPARRYASRIQFRRVTSLRATNSR